MEATNYDGALIMNVDTGELDILTYLTTLSDLYGEDLYVLEDNKALGYVSADFLFKQNNWEVIGWID